jgi:hypothetical protein
MTLVALLMMVLNLTAFAVCSYDASFLIRKGKITFGIILIGLAAANLICLIHNAGYVV